MYVCVYGKNDSLPQLVLKLSLVGDDSLRENFVLGLYNIVLWKFDDSGMLYINV